MDLLYAHTRDIEFTSRLLIAARVLIICAPMFVSLVRDGAEGIRFHNRLNVASSHDPMLKVKLLQVKHSRRFFFKPG